MVLTVTTPQDSAVASGRRAGAGRLVPFDQRDRPPVGGQAVGDARAEHACPDHDGAGRHAPDARTGTMHGPSSREDRILTSGDDHLSQSQAMAGYAQAEGVPVAR